MNIIKCISKFVSVTVAILSLSLYYILFSFFFCFTRRDTTNDDCDYERATKIRERETVRTRNATIFFDSIFCLLYKWRKCWILLWNSNPLLMNSFYGFWTELNISLCLICNNFVCTCHWIHFSISDLRISQETQHFHPLKILFSYLVFNYRDEDPQYHLVSTIFHLAFLLLYEKHPCV